MSKEKRLTAKIDLKDALFGGAAIYVSVLLVTYLLIFGTDIALKLSGLINGNGEFVAGTGIFSESLYPLFIAVIFAVFLILFFLIVLFEESLFSKHEKGAVDLLGLGLVWGMVFVTIDTILETLVMYISIFQNWTQYYMLSIRSSFFGPFYWFAVLYIIFLPVVLHKLRNNHREHYKKIAEGKNV